MHCITQVDKSIFSNIEKYNVSGSIDACKCVSHVVKCNFYNSISTSFQTAKINHINQARFICKEINLKSSKKYYEKDHGEVQNCQQAQQRRLGQELTVVLSQKSFSNDSVCLGSDLKTSDNFKIFFLLFVKAPPVRSKFWRVKGISKIEIQI